MSGTSEGAGWGPSHQGNRRKPSRPWWVLLPAYVLVGVWFVQWRTTTTFLLIVLPALLVLFAIERLVVNAPRAAKAWATEKIAQAPDPLAIVRDGARQDGGGVYLGIKENGDWQHSRPERAVLLLGPPEPVSHCPFRVPHCANSPVSD